MATIKAYTDEQQSKKLAKILPKFKVGDWIAHDVDANYVYHVESVGVCYHLRKGGALVLMPFIEEKYYHLWTIQDAKAGDVLCCKSGWTCVFKTLINDETFSSYCFMDNTKWFCETGSECHTLKEEFVKAYNGKIYPATKEQRDLLFQKMEEAGFEWDAEKKELKKVEHKSAEKVEPKFGVGDIIRHKDTNETFEVSRIEIFDADEIYYHLTNGCCICEYSDNFERVEQKPADGSSAFKNKLLELFQRFRWYCKDETPTNGDIIDYVDAHIQELIDTIQKPA